MNHSLLKKTLIRTLKWYPVVIGVMVVLGIAIAQMKGDPFLAVVLAVIGGLVGPGMEAVFYYQGQLKKERAAGLSAAQTAADHLRQASELFKAGLLQEAEYERICRAVRGAPAGDPLRGSVAEEQRPGVKMQTAADGAAFQMKINPWLALLVAMSWPMMGMLLSMVLGMLFDLELSKLVRSVISLIVSSFGVLYLFPKVYAAPFGPVPIGEYLKRLGVYLPRDAWRHGLLGMVLAGCTLSGMLVASLLTGKYVVDWRSITLGQIVFSLNAGIFEEIFYRGMIVMLLLPLTKSLGRAWIGQIVIFGLAHLKGVDPIAFVEVISVMIIAVAFSYAAYKTRALLAGMVFHFLHDAFLFVVQLPGGVYEGVRDNLIFYSILWLMVGVACVVIWFATERLKVRGEVALYTPDVAANP